MNAHILGQKVFNSYEMVGILKIFSFFLPVFAIYRICSASLIGLKKADVESNIRNILIPLFFIVSLGFIVIMGGKLYEIVAMRIISYVLAIGCIFVFILSKYASIFKARSNSYNLKEFISFSSPLLLIGLLYFLMGQTDILMLGYFTNERQVGIYTVVVRIAIIVILGLEIINQTIEPNISELAARNDFESMERLLKVLTKWISYISLFIFVLIIIFRTELLAIFGPSFTEGSTALVILASGQLVNSFAGPTGKLLVMTGKQKWEVFNSISMLILNVILNILLIPKFGVVGAAIATTTSLSIINVLKLLETYKEFKIHPYSYRYLKGIIAIMSGAGIVYCFYRLLNLVQLNIILSVVLGTSILLLATFLIFFFIKLDPEDKIIFDMYARKLLPKISS
jgi:O-antigen/teichoic acid export membrane protein